jgi:glycine/D-amino acid oxidase-like deaminating enzyme
MSDTYRATRPEGQDGGRSDASITNGGVSYWVSSLGAPGPAAQHPALGNSTDTDVCIVGGGYTGLWTAYYLRKADPDLRITVLERRSCGFGASGRNGGWLYNGFAGRKVYAEKYGRSAATFMQHAMDQTVDEVIRAAADESIDADIVKGGVLQVARTPAQLTRMREFAEDERVYGIHDRSVLDAQQTRERVNVAGAVGGTWTPHGARIQPAKLVLGLAKTVARMGVNIYESTPVERIEPANGTRQARAITPYGTVTARYVLRLTEGFTADLAGQRRTWLPMNSSIVLTEPLPRSFWDEIGWPEGCVLGNFAHAYMYAQRTVDGRIAFGGRGIPYRYGSRTDNDGTTHPRTIEQLRGIMRDFFPQLGAKPPLSHTWSGVFGVPRDWCPTVQLDPASGLGAAGGYVGSGVATTNLAARTLRDLILRSESLGGDTELTALPWVNHQVRRWEPEPLRYLGIYGLYAAYHAADRAETASGRERSSTIARVADLISGH